MVGMGYVGLTYALYLTGKDQEVIGIDVNEGIRDKINSGELPFFEKDLQNRLVKSLNGNLLTVIDPASFIPDRATPSVFIITVGTPVKDQKLDYTSLEAVFEFLRKVVQPEDGVILRSTVSVGSSRRYCERLDSELLYCFAPERTIEGNAVYELESLPQVFGANSQRAKKHFHSFFERYHNEVLEVSTTEAAELVKLTSNVYRDVSFGFSNEIANISYSYGVNSTEIINACNYKYPRCNIPKSGPVSGPCLTKDSYILFNEKTHLTSVILNARKLNEEYTLDILSDILKKRQVNTVCVFGIAFKGNPPTSDIRDSLAIPIINFLRRKNLKVSGYDPVVFQEDFDRLGLQRYVTIEEAIGKSELIVIQNNNNIFAQVDFNRFAVDGRKTIVDFWSIVPECNNVNIEIIKI